ncbi:MAG: signal peptide peptidase SppA [Bacteroidales bacterium]|nr:signal peptide peptidase SppA [Candidatus Colimorpha onthohippi]
MESYNTRQPLGFGKTMLASALGFIIGTAALSMIGILVVASMLVSAVSSVSQDPSPVPDNIFVQIDLDRQYCEQPPNELQQLITSNEFVSLHEITEAIRHAQTDDKVKGLYLNAADGGRLTWGQCDELRNAIVQFKQSGKPVIAYGNSYSQTDYYLASAADRVILNPAGIVDFRGIAAESIFIKDLAEKLGIRVELIRPGSNSYKSAGEMYTMTHFSNANREQIRSYIQGTWDYATSQISQSRNINSAKLNTIADNLDGMIACDALSNQLIDTLAFEHGAHQIIKNIYNADKTISAHRYAQSIQKSTDANKIAIVYAEGDVMVGQADGYNTAVYSETLVEALDQAAKNQNIKAIVLRINSPGGAVTASEVISDAVRRANSQKPVVVSMGSLAASAGYEIASGASTIVAQPITLTGSIGVFGVVPDFSSLLRDRLGISTDTVCTNNQSAGLSVTRPLSPKARAMMQRNVESFYDTFCMRVSQGRGLDIKTVDSIGRGRVWIGTDALKLGLVDTLGYLSTAIQIAAQKADITTYTTVNYPKSQDLMSQLFGYRKHKDETQLSAQVNQIIPYYSQLKEWSSMDPMQARLPFIMIGMQ